MHIYLAAKVNLKEFIFTWIWFLVVYSIYAQLFRLGAAHLGGKIVVVWGSGPFWPAFCEQSCRGMRHREYIAIVCLHPPPLLASWLHCWLHLFLFYDAGLCYILIATHSHKDLNIIVWPKLYGFHLVAITTRKQKNMPLPGFKLGTRFIWEFGDIYYNRTSLKGVRQIRRTDNSSLDCVLFALL